MRCKGIQIAVAISLMLAACSENEVAPVASPSIPDQTDASPTPIASRSEEEPTPSPVPKGRPAWAAAISEDARLVILSTSTGEEIRELEDLSGRIHPDREFPLETLALSPDRKHVYYTEVLRSEKHVVMRVPITGGDPERIVFGAAPSISPDGRRIAFSFPADGNRHTNHNAIGVLDLGTGDRREWRLDENEEDFFQVGGHIYSTSWHPSTERIAYYFDYEGPEVRILDLGAESLSRSEGVEGVIAWPSWISEARLAVVTSCCFPEFRRDPGSVAVVDTGGAVHRELRTGEAATHLDPDGSGRRFLVVLEDGTIELTKQGGSPAFLTSGYVVAIW